MRKILLVLILFSWIRSPLVRAEGQPPGSLPSYTLKEAARQALANNPGLRAVSRQREAARAQSQQAHSFYWPRVDVAETFTNGNNPVYVFGTLLGQQAFSAANFDIHALNHPDPLNNFKTDLTVYQSVWEGGKTQARNEQAHLNEDLKAREEEQARQGLLFEVVRHYFAIQLARENLATSESALSSAEANRKRVQDLYDSGQVVQSDVLRLQVYLAEVQRQQIEAQNQFQLAQAALQVDLGNPPDSGCETATPLRPPAPAPPEEPAYQAAAAAQRPEILRLQTAVRMAKQQVRETRGDYYPALGLFTTLEYNQGTGADRSGANYILGAQLKFNLFDGQAKGARVAEARANAGATEAQLENLRHQVAMQVKDAFLQLRTAQLQHAVAAAAVSQAEEALRIVKNRHEAGLAPLTDLLNSETALTGARTNLTQSMYQYDLAWASLELAAGTLSLESRIFE